MNHTVFTLDVRLEHIAPPIWRTVEVPGTVSLAGLHYALQVAMGWTNSHLHQFVIGSKRFGMTHIDPDAPDELVDERTVRLQDVARQGDAFVYEYDFGDGWRHAITVKDISAAKKQPGFRCIAGARACPPEDCGGPPGYANLLAVLADPQHPQHAELAEWAGPLEPERFSVPKSGHNLGPEMDELAELAEGDDEDDDGDDELPMNLPRPLIEALLALDPMQRAALCALLAGSLAEDVVETQEALQTARAPKPRARPASSRAHRKRR